MFWIYILECADGSFYTGHTDNLGVRITQHQQGTFVDCYTFQRRPLKLVYAQDFPSRHEAFQAERKVKNWSRAKKMALIKGNWHELSVSSKPRPKEIE